MNSLSKGKVNRAFAFMTANYVAKVLNYTNSDGLSALKGVMGALKEIGCGDLMTVELEPHTYDPTE